MIDTRFYLIVWIYISLVTRDGEHLFMSLFIYMYYLEEGLFKPSDYFSIRLFVFLFIFFVLNCTNSFHILKIMPWLVALFANIFSYSVFCLYFLMIPFVIQKLLNLIRFYLFIFIC